MNKSAQTAEAAAPSDYGQFSYQGAYVYHFNLVKGFTLRGKITHLKDEDILKSGQ